MFSAGADHTVAGEHSHRQVKGSINSQRLYDRQYTERSGSFASAVALLKRMALFSTEVVVAGRKEEHDAPVTRLF